MSYLELSIKGGNRFSERDKYFYGTNGVQDTLPQNMISWYIECFRLKELEEWQVQEGLSDLPLKQVIRPSHERCPPQTHRKEAVLLQKTKGQREEFKQTLLASPPFTTLNSYLSPYHVLLQLPILIKASIKTFRLSHFFASSFPYEGRKSCATENLY